MYMIYLYVLSCIIFICIELYIFIYVYILTNLHSDVELSKMFQTKLNLAVLFLFPNLSKNYLPELPSFKLMT